MPKCDFKNVDWQLCWKHTSPWVFSCKFAAYFQNTFPKNASGRLLLNSLWNQFKGFSVQMKDPTKTLILQCKAGPKKFP